MKFARIKSHFVRLDQIRNFGHVSNHVYIDFISGNTSGLTIPCRDADEAAKICLNIELKMSLM